MSINDYTPSEISTLWFDDDEMHRIAQRCCELIVRMEYEGSSFTSRKYCIRGLEGHSRLGSANKKTNRAAAIASVLVEQSKQWAEDEVDEHAIAEAYQRTTFNCKRWAHEMGKRDQQAAEAVLSQDMQNYRVHHSGNVKVSSYSSDLHSRKPKEISTNQPSIFQISSARAA